MPNSRASRRCAAGSCDEDTCDKNPSGPRNIEKLECNGKSKELKTNINKNNKRLIKNKTNKKKKQKEEKKKNKKEKMKKKKMKKKKNMRTHTLALNTHTGKLRHSTYSGN